MTALVAAAAAGLAVLLVGPVSAARPSGSGVVSPAEVGPEQAPLRRMRVPLVVLAVLGGWVVLGGPVGVVVGALGGVVGWRVLTRVESPAAVRDREILERELPTAVHLLGACLGAGVSTTNAVLAVAEALPGPVALEFRAVHHRLLLGLDPSTVWRALDGPLRPLGRAMARAHESGGSVRTAVDHLSEDLRSQTRARTEALARTVEVRAAAPLGVCFLPAFVLLGVVPMAVGIFSSLRLFG